jgi:gamma-glutamyltranspeptidase
MDNPFDALSKLADAIDRSLDDLDLTRVAFNAIPGEGGHPDTIAIVFEVSSAAFADKDQLLVDSEFDNLVSGLMSEKKEEEKKDKLKKMMEEWMMEEE